MESDDPVDVRGVAPAHDYGRRQALAPAACEHQAVALGEARGGQRKATQAIPRIGIHAG